MFKLNSTNLNTKLYISIIILPFPHSIYEHMSHKNNLHFRITKDVNRISIQHSILMSLSNSIQIKQVHSRVQLLKINKIKNFLFEKETHIFYYYIQSVTFLIKYLLCSYSKLELCTTKYLKYEFNTYLLVWNNNINISIFNLLISCFLFLLFFFCLVFQFYMI